MNRFYLILGHICISLSFVLVVLKLRQHAGLPMMDWTLVLIVIFYWLGVLTARKNRAK